MEKLPDEILRMIFEYIPPLAIGSVVANVCQRWDRVAGRLVQVVSDAASYRRWCRSGGVRHLYILAREPVMASSLTYLASAFHLSHLTIHLGMPLSSRELMVLSELRLHHVDVFCRAEILGDAAVPLASNVKSFVVNEPVAPGFLCAVAKRAKLQALHMYGRAGCYPRSEMRELLVSQCLRFTELTLRCPTLKERDYAVIGQCASLRALKLYCCWELGADAAVRLAALPRLHTLHLTGTRRSLDSAGMLRLVRALPAGVTELCLSASRLADEHVAPLARRLPRLALLELWRTRLSAAALLRLLRLLPRLRELDVDMPVSARTLQQMQLHPALATVRAYIIEEAFETRLRVISAKAVDAAAVTQLGGACEGVRAHHLYHWTQHVPLPPLGDH